MNTAYKKNLKVIITDEKIIVECKSMNDSFELYLTTTIKKDEVIDKIIKKYNLKELYNTHNFEIEDYLLKEYPNLFQYSNCEI